MKYYKVTCERGHVGTGYNNAFITFYITAQNALHASNIARKMGGVKHSKLPIACIEITLEEYLKNRATNAYERAFAKGKKNEIFELKF